MVRKTRLWERKLNPLPIKMTEVYAFVPPAQNTWHGDVSSQGALPRGRILGLNPARTMRFWKSRFELLGEM